MNARLRALTAPAAVAAGAVAVLAAVSIANPTVPGGVLPVCPTKLLFGFDCPGCGTLRMLYSVAHLDFGAAIRYNALAFVILGLLTVSYFAWTYGRVKNVRVRQWFELRGAPGLLIVAIAVWAVIRNLPFAPFTGLYV